MLKISYKESTEKRYEGAHWPSDAEYKDWEVSIRGRGALDSVFVRARTFWEAVDLAFFSTRNPWAYTVTEVVQRD